MDNIFTNLNEGAQGVEPVVEKEVPKKSNKKAKVEEMKQALKETIMTDPAFTKKLRSFSGDLEVIHTLGFGDSGNIVVDKSKAKKGDENDRPLAVTSKIVGYRVKNIGKEPVKYQTEVWTQGKDGKFVGAKAEKTLEPGGIADFTRQYMTMFCAQPEISFQLANGKIIKGSGSKGNKDVKAELESYYFRFDKDENGEVKQVNDDDVKLNVGEKVDGKWVVKKEYEEVFGFLNNPSEGGGRRRKSSKDKFSTQDLAANYVNKLIQDAGL